MAKGKLSKRGLRQRWLGGIVAAWSCVACSGSVEDSSESGGNGDGGSIDAPVEPSASSSGPVDVTPGAPDVTPNPTPDDTDGNEPNPTTPPDDEVPGVFPDGTPAPAQPPGNEIEECDLTANESPLIKLSTIQYRNTVRDLLTQLGAEELIDDVEGLLNAIPDDSRSDLFSGLDTRIALEHVEGYFNVAKLVAQGVVTDDDLLREVAGDCALEASLSDECLNDFVDVIGALAYRHPLTNEELAELALHASDLEDTRDRVRAVILAAMISPRFVHHVEVDGAWVSDTSDVLQLSPYEIVSRLSYTFWQTMPDAELFAAAADGSVLTSAGLTSALDHVLEDPRAKTTVWNFWREWLGLDNFTGFEFGRPGFEAMTEGLDLSEDLYSEMVDEVRALTEQFTFNQAGTFRDLLETNVSVTQSAQLASLYGVDAWSGQGDFPSLKVDERAGLFQRAALLVSSLEQTNPFHRGAFVKRNLLCEALPSPDPAALPPGSLDIPPTSEAETTRQRYENKVANNDLCTGCHGLFSSVGYALEAYDSLGRHRTVERVFDDASGELLAELAVDPVAEVTIGGETRTVQTPAELNQLMVDHGNVDACLSSQYFRFVTRRNAATATSDACVTREVATVTQTDGLRAGFRHIAELTTFYQRRVGAQ